MVRVHDELIEQYVLLQDHFGLVATTMRRHRAIRRTAVANRKETRS